MIEGWHREGCIRLAASGHLIDGISHNTHEDEERGLF